MSCLNVTTTNLSPLLHIGVGRLGGIIVKVKEVSGIIVKISWYNPILLFDATDILKDKHLKLTCKIICNVNYIY